MVIGARPGTMQLRHSCAQYGPAGVPSRYCRRAIRRQTSACLSPTNQLSVVCRNDRRSDSVLLCQEPAAAVNHHWHKRSIGCITLSFDHHRRGCCYLERRRATVHRNAGPARSLNRSTRAPAAQRAYEALRSRKRFRRHSFRNFWSSVDFLEARPARPVPPKTRVLPVSRRFGEQAALDEAGVGYFPMSQLSNAPELILSLASQCVRFW